MVSGRAMKVPGYAPFNGMKYDADTRCTGNLDTQLKAKFDVALTGVTSPNAQLVMPDGRFLGIIVTAGPAAGQTVTVNKHARSVRGLWS